MPDKNSEVDDFLGDIKNDSADDSVFDASKDSVFQDESGPTGPTGTREDNEVKHKVPFHKDPKVLKFIEKEVEKRTKDLKPQQVVVENKSDEIDEVLTRIIGNDTPEKVRAVQDFKKVLLEREEKGAERALEEFQLRVNAEREAEKEAREVLNDGFSSIEETFNVDLTSSVPQARKLRGEFIEFIRQVAPKNDDGDITEYPDFEQTFKVFQELRKKTPVSNQRNKDLASRSMERSGDTTKEPVVEDKSWNAVDRIFSKLTG
jgi:hypothetical protein